MTKCLKILNIEDDINSRELLKCVLVAKIPGVDVVFAQDKSEAEKLKNEKWDLIICDGDIPSWSNHFDDVKKWFDSPIVMLSARNQCDLDIFLENGAHKTFQKNPGEFLSLIDYVKNLLDQETTSA